MTIKSIAVFCGASNVKEPLMQLAYNIGKIIASKNKKLIYGGASIGLMGQVAAGCLDQGGHVTGIMPRELIDRWEVAHDGLSEFYATENMHQRKQKMYDLSDVFLILPGGFGTLDELFETLTWKQIGYHKKPIYLLNYMDFHKDLLQFFDTMHNNGFINDKHLKDIQVLNTIEEFEEIISIN